MAVREHYIGTVYYRGTKFLRADHVLNYLEDKADQIADRDDIEEHLRTGAVAVLRDVMTALAELSDQ